MDDVQKKGAVKSKKSKRKVHINGEEWVWIVDTNRYRYADEIRIYSPNKKMTRVPAEKFFEKEIKEECNPGMITPALIKTYIEKKLIPQSDGNPA